MNKTRTIVIDNKEAEQLQAFLDGKGHGSLNTIMTYTADFGEGMQADIKVCDAEKDSTPFIDAVLFHESSDIGCLDVGDELLGEYVFDYDDDDTYTVIVTTDKKLRNKARLYELLGAFCLVILIMQISIFAHTIATETWFMRVKWFVMVIIVTIAVVCNFRRASEITKQIPRKLKIKS